MRVKVLARISTYLKNMVPCFQSYSTDPILNVEPMQLLIKDTLHIYVINFNEKETQFFNIIWLPISLICYSSDLAHAHYLSYVANPRHSIIVRTTACSTTQLGFKSLWMRILNILELFKFKYLCSWASNFPPHFCAENHIHRMKTNKNFV